MEKPNKILTIEEWAIRCVNGDHDADAIVCSQSNAHFAVVKDDIVLRDVDQEELLQGGQLRHVISDETVDRHGDIVRVRGWDTKNYMNNPVILWAHDSGQPPVGRSVRISKNHKDKRLVSVGEYPSADLYEFGNTVFRLSANGFLNAVSVGFMPKEYDYIDEKNPLDGYDITKQELWEYSIVPIPANPNALQLAANTMPGGIPFVRRWAEQILDMTKEETSLEKLRDALRNVEGNIKRFVVDGVEFLPNRKVDAIDVLSEEVKKLPEAKEPLAEKKEYEAPRILDAQPLNLFEGTRDHEEELEIKKEVGEDPVVFTLIDEPTFEIDSSVITNMVADAVTAVTGRLIDREV